MFEILVEELKKFFESENKIELTKNLRERRDKYLMDSDDFFGWFSEMYEIVEDDNYLTAMKDIFTEFKRGDYYMNLTKMMKRKMNRKKFLEELLSRSSIKNIFRERYQRKDKNLYSVFVGLKKKVDCEIEDSEDEEE